MTPGAKGLLARLLVSEEEHLLGNVSLKSRSAGGDTHAFVDILRALGVDVGIREVLTAEGTHELVFLELACITIN